MLRRAGRGFANYRAGWRVVLVGWRCRGLRLIRSTRLRDAVCSVDATGMRMRHGPDAHCYHEGPKKEGGWGGPSKLTGPLALIGALSLFQRRPGHESGKPDSGNCHVAQIFGEEEDDRADQYRDKAREHQKKTENHGAAVQFHLRNAH